MHDRHGARRATTRLLAGLTVLVGLIVGTLGVQEGGRPVVAQDVGDAALRLTATSMAATIEALGAVVTAAARATYIAELQQQAADLVAGQTATAAAAMPQATPSPRMSPTATRALTPTATTAAKAPPKAPTAQARGCLLYTSPSPRD